MYPVLVVVEELGSDWCQSILPSVVYGLMLASRHLDISVVNWLGCLCVNPATSATYVAAFFLCC